MDNPKKCVVSLFSLPAPGQKIMGTGSYLNTVRTQMHKAPLTALVAGTAKRLRIHNLEERFSFRIVDLQIPSTGKAQDRVEVKYGELSIEGLILEKFYVGRHIEDSRDDVLASDVIGINCNFTHSRGIVWLFIAYVRKLNSKCLIVVGGTDASADPDAYLQRGADVAVKGEGELSFPDLLAKFVQGESFVGISNISYKENQQIRTNDSSYLNASGMFDVDTMPPPDLDIVNIEHYTDTGQGLPPLGLEGPFISIETSRGCAQACSFCSSPTTKGRYRFMSTDKIRDHFEYFREKGIRSLLFQEDNVLSRVHQYKGKMVFENGRQELLSLMSLAREYEFNWEFTNGLEFGLFYRDGLIDQELIDSLFYHKFERDKFVGCFRATIPLENVTDENFKAFRKLRQLDVGIDIIRSIVSTGVSSLTFNVIIGRPEDDEDTLVITYQRCMLIKRIVTEMNPKLRIYFAVFIATLLPGTKDFRLYKDLLAFDLDTDPEIITVFAGCMKTPHFSPLQITQARGSMAMMLNSESLINDYDENYFITSDYYLGLFEQECESLASGTEAGGECLIASDVNRPGFTGVSIL